MTSALKNDKVSQEKILKMVEHSHWGPAALEQFVRPKKLLLAVPLEGNLYFGFGVTKALVQMAFEQGAHLRRPDATSEQTWAQQIDRVRRYIDTDATLEQIGQEYHVTREAVRQSIVKGIDNLRNGCPLPTQLLFPSGDQLDLGKPLSQAALMRASEARGGKSAAMAACLQAGKTVTELRELGFSSTEIAHSRVTLKRWGKEIPYISTAIIKTVKNRQLAEAMRNATTDEEIQRLLGEVTRSFYRTNTSGANPLLSNLGRLVRRDFFARPQDYHLFADSLTRTEPSVPWGMLEWFNKTGPQQDPHHDIYLLRRHEERALQAFYADTTLEPFLRNPVRLICGTRPDQLPSTAQLQSQVFCPTSYLFAKCGIKVGGNSKFRAAHFFTPDCDTLIFGWGEAHYYLISQETALRTFVENRLQKMLS